MALDPRLRSAVAGAINKYGRSNGKFVKPKEGRNVYRIVAPVDPALLGPNGEFWADCGVHWIKTALNGKPIAVVGSADVCFQEPCEVGIAVEMAIAQAKLLGLDEDTTKIIDEMKVTRSVLFIASDRTAKADNEDLDIIELRPTAAQQVLDLMMQYEDAGEDLFALDSGVDLVVTRSGKGMQTEYTVNVKPGKSAPVSKAVLAKCPNLRDVIRKEYFKGEEQKAINAIQQIAGINVPRLAASGGLQISANLVAAKTGNAALAQSSASVPDAELETALAELNSPATSDVEIEDPAVTAAKAILAKATADAAAAVKTAQDNAAAAQKAASEAAAATTAKAAAIAATATVETGSTGLSDAEVDDVLAQLKNL